MSSHPNKCTLIKISFAGVQEQYEERRLCFDGGVGTPDGERIKVMLDIWCIVTLHIIYGHNNNNLYLYYELHLPATVASQNGEL